MTANLFEHTHAHWAKYSDYEWRTAPDGHDYLLPCPLLMRSRPCMTPFRKPMHSS